MFFGGCIKKVFIRRRGSRIVMLIRRPGRYRSRRIWINPFDTEADRYNLWKVIESEGFISDRFRLSEDRGIIEISPFGPARARGTCSQSGLVAYLAILIWAVLSYLRRLGRFIPEGPYRLGLRGAGLTAAALTLPIVFNSTNALSKPLKREGWVAVSYYLAGHGTNDCVLYYWDPNRCPGISVGLDNADTRLTLSLIHI